MNQLKKKSKQMNVSLNDYVMGTCIQAIGDIGDDKGHKICCAIPLGLHKKDELSEDPPRLHNNIGLVQMLCEVKGTIEENA